MSNPPIMHEIQDRANVIQQHVLYMIYAPWWGHVDQMLRRTSYTVEYQMVTVCATRNTSLRFNRGVDSWYVNRSPRVSLLSSATNCHIEGFDRYLESII